MAALPRAHGSILAPHTTFMLSAYLNPRYRRSRGAMSGARSQVTAAAAGLGLVVAPSCLPGCYSGRTGAEMCPGFSDDRLGGATQWRR
jgi:hypothetical protein